MPSPAIFPRDKIRELLALAEVAGESRASLPSGRDASRFRFAIYSFRRNAGVGKDISVTLDGNAVVLTRREAPEVNIVQGD